MLMSKGLFKRVVAGFMSLVMIFTIMPYAGTPVLAAEADSGITYATDPTWYELGTGPSDQVELKLLGDMLRHKYNDPTANEKNEIGSDLAGLDSCYTGDTLYIKLNTDIDVKFDPYTWTYMSHPTMKDKTANWCYNLPVYGKKVLDLNGHKIKVQQEDDGYQVGDPFLKIMDGATLTIVDSKGGGKMIANSWIKMYFNLFYVYSGGELIINAPGATFESGFSEKVWLTGAYKEGEIPRADVGEGNTGIEQTYNGYARNQASGTAISVLKGGKLTVSGGTVKGRGYTVADVSGYNFPCAAITGYGGADIRIIDGNFYGMGGAGALDIGDEANLTIESGVFDVYKVDKLVLPKADRDEKQFTLGDSFAGAFLGIFGATFMATRDAKVDNYEDGCYGNIGIPSRVLDELAAKGTMVEVIQGDHDVSGDELSDDDTGLDTYWDTKRVTIRPKSGSATHTNRMNMEPVKGMYRWNPETADSYTVNVSINERYFSDQARDLSTSYYRPRKGRDYGDNDKDKEYYLEYKFYLYDNNGNKVAYLGEKLMRPETTSLTEVDLTKLYDLSQSKNYIYDIDKWQALDQGKYIVRCELSEIWKGEHSYKSTWYTTMALTIRKSDHDLMSVLNESDFQPDFVVSHTECWGNVDSPPVMSLILSDETQRALKDAVDKAKEMTYQVEREGYKENVKYNPFLSYSDITVTYELRDYNPDGNTFETLSRSVMPNEYSTLSSATSGAKVITATIGIPQYQISNGNIVGYDYISVSKNFLLLPPMERSDGEKSGYYEALALSDGQKATVAPVAAENSNLAALAEKGDFSWQWYFIPGGHDMHPSVEDLYASEYTKFSTESDITLTPLDGSYRLECTYLPGKDGCRTQKFVSAPVDIAGADENRVLAELTASDESFTFSQEDLLDAVLTLKCTGMTNEIESVQFSMKGYPDGMYSRPVKLEKSGSNTYTVGLVDFESLAEAWEDGGYTIDPSGEYTFRAIVRCKEDGWKNYRVYSNYVTVTMVKGAQGYSLHANNQYLGEGYSQQSLDASAALDALNAQVIPLYLDSATRSVTFTTEYYPKNATHDDRFVNEDEDNINYEWSVMDGTSVISLTGDKNQSYAYATIKEPGTAVIAFKKWAGTGSYNNAPDSKKIATYFKVCVPVTEVEFEQPNYQDYIGSRYVALGPKVTAYATCGAYCDGSAFDFYDYGPVYRDNGTSSNVDKVIAANDKGDVVYKLHLVEDQSYPLLKDSEDSLGNANYVVNTAAVKVSIVQPDGSKITKTAEDWGANDDNSMVSLGSVTPEASQAYFKLAQDVFVKNSGAQYIDVVTITTTEPGVGDPINEKITVYTEGGYERYPQPVYGQYKAANVFSLSNVKAKDTENDNLNRSIIMLYQSAVSKATAETAGAAYTDADSAKAETGKSFGELVDKSYENGTYFHEIQLVTNSNATEDGTKYYFAPDCKIILNGHLLDFGDRTMYNSKDDYSTLTFKYFFDVGDVNTVSAVNLTGIKPLQGNVPAEPANVTATGTDLTGSTPATVDLSVNRITWFVDENGNGAYDEGEEVNIKWDTTINAEGKKEATGYDAENSTLWWDGTFLPGVAYSALIEIGAQDSATRLAENIEVACDDQSILLTGGKRQFVVTFKPDNTIRAIHVPVPVGAAAANPDRDPLGLFNASNQGYTTEINEVYKHDPASDSKSSTENVSNFYSGDNLASNTLDTGKYWMVLRFDRKGDFLMADDMKVLVNGVYTGEFGYGTDQLKDLFVQRRSTYAAAWRTFNVPEGEDTPSGDILLGDVNGDGVVDILDLQKLFGHLQGISVITDAERLKAADTTGNETIDILDYQKLFGYLQGISSLS